MTVLLAVVAGLAATILACAAVSAVNLRKNRTVGAEGLLLDQCTAPCSRLRYGFFRASYNGCGVVATYNAAYLLGKRIHPSEIIRRFERCGALLFGLFGTLPFAPRRFFRRSGCAVTTSRRREDFDRLAKSHKVSILWYFHRRGAHFITLQWDGTRYVGYNVFSGSGAPTPLGASLADFLQDRRCAVPTLTCIDPQRRHPCSR